MVQTVEIHDWEDTHHLLFSRRSAFALAQNGHHLTVFTCLAIHVHGLKACLVERACLC